MKSRKVAVALAAAGALAVVGAPTAMAQSGNTVELRKAGVTRLTLASSAADALGSLGVSVAPIRPSKVGHSGAIRFPITGGEIDPSTAAGVINHSGGLRLSAGGTVVRLRNFRIRGTTLSAAVGGDRVPIIRLGLGNAKITRPGLGTKVSNVAVRLNATGRGRAERRLRDDGAEGGLPPGHGRGGRQAEAADPGER